ncbi:hypothetical protein HL42_8175 [Trichophyton rubrum]|nr:hypothetical protein HL42_8175 [Trichophyton rubrum]
MSCEPVESAEAHAPDFITLFSTAALVPFIYSPDAIPVLIQLSSMNSGQKTHDGMIGRRHQYRTALPPTAHRQESGSSAVPVASKKG